MKSLLGKGIAFALAGTMVLGTCYAEVEQRRQPIHQREVLKKLKCTQSLTRKFRQHM